MLRLLLRPRTTNLVLDRMGERARMLDPLFHNTASATVLDCDDKFNVIPGEVTAVLDGRLLPGFVPDDLLAELRALLGDASTSRWSGSTQAAGARHGPLPTLAGILERADPGATATPLLMPGVSDARFFARLGIQNYGFLPMKLPPDFEFWSGVHGADERVPAAAVEFGAAAVHEALGPLRRRGGARGGALGADRAVHRRAAARAPGAVRGRRGRGLHRPVERRDVRARRLHAAGPGRGVDRARAPRHGR